MNAWRNGKEWSDKFLPEIKQILGLHLIAEPPIEEDQERNTDLTVLRMDAIRIGCRIRRHCFLQQYPNQFTIRASLPSGRKTELAKIIEGWGQYLFYGFCDLDERCLSAWRLVDLNVFRLWWSRQLVANHGKLPGIAKDNQDGSSAFRAFDVSGMPATIVTAAKCSAWAICGTPGNMTTWQDAGEPR